MIDQAQLAYDRGLGYSLSTFAGRGERLSRDELILQIAAVRPIPNPKLATTTAAQLRGIDCELVADDPMPLAKRPQGCLGLMRRGNLSTSDNWM